MIQLIARLFYAPTTAYTTLRDRGNRTTVILFFSVVLSMAILLAIYYAKVDVIWLRSQLFHDMDEDKRVMAETIVSRSVLATTGIISGIIRATVWLIALSLYYYLADFTGERRYPMRRWIGYVAASQVPLILLLPIGLASLSSSADGRLLPDQLDSTSLLAMGVNGGTLSMQHLLASVSIVKLWPVALQMIGLRVWSGRSMIQCIMLPLVPMLSLYAFLGFKALGAS